MGDQIQGHGAVETEGGFKPKIWNDVDALKRKEAWKWRTDRKDDQICFIKYIWNDVKPSVEMLHDITEGSQVESDDIYHFSRDVRKT